MVARGAGEVNSGHWRTGFGQVFGIDTRSLALFRIALATVLLVNLATRARDLRTMYTDAGWLPGAAIARYFGENSWHWSLHWLDGGERLAATLFLIAGGAAGLLLLGLWTRLATVVSWVLLASLHTRAPVLVSGGDVLLCMLLLWGIFLPLNRHWSLDARRRPAPPPAHIVNIPTALMLLQVGFMYWFTGLSKCNELWFRGEALANVLSYDMIARPLGQALLAYPGVLRILTWATLAWELVGPYLLFVPSRQQRIRLLAVAGFVLLHVGIELTMRVVIFSYISLAALTLFIPGRVWDRWPHRRSAASPARAVPVAASVRWGIGALHTALAVLFVFAVAFNLIAYFGGVRGFQAIPGPARRLASLTVVGQRWNMFDWPAAGDYRFVAAATLTSGRQVDLLRNQDWFDFEHPKRLSGKTTNQRWMLAFVEMSRSENRYFCDLLARYLAQEWNRRHPPDAHVETVTLLLAFEVRSPAEDAGRTRTLWLAQYEPRGEGDYEQGQRQGPWRFHHASGTPRAAGVFQAGQESGVWKFWYENGQLARCGEFVQGREEGPWVFYYENGQKEMEGRFIAGQKEGHWVHWDRNGHKEGEGPYLHDELDGTWQIWFEGRPVEACFRGGVRVAAPQKTTPSPSTEPEAATPESATPGVESSRPQD